MSALASALRQGNTQDWESDGQHAIGSFVGYLAAADISCQDILSDSASSIRRAVRPTPERVKASLWRGNELGSASSRVLSSGYAALDAELPGGGWPTQAITELLQAQACVAEWRLLSPVMQAVAAAQSASLIDKQIVLIAPPLQPHPPGLFSTHEAGRSYPLIWIDTNTPAERLWVLEQVIKANAAALILCWLPQVRPEQLRRLQVHAQGHDSPIFICRSMQAMHEASAAPLRIALQSPCNGDLELQIFKRRGPAHTEILKLPAMPQGMERLLTPRLRYPNHLWADRMAAAAPPTLASTPASPASSNSRVFSHVMGRADSRRSIPRSTPVTAG